jgi:hypothetical protein
MLPLRSLQADFVRSLGDPDLEIPSDLSSHTSNNPKKRFDVYRNNVTVSLTGALAAQFPAVCRLLGDEFFQMTAKVFIDRHPPSSPLLFLYGEEFPGFLGNFEQVQDLPYLPDVAQLEWLWAQSYHAADRTPLTPEQLAEIPVDRLDSVRFELHPSTGLLSSPYPAVSLWQTNVTDEEVRVIDIGQGGEDALVVRPALDVQVRRIPPGAHLMISELRLGATLGEAALAVAEQQQDFDLQLALSELLPSGAIVRLETA